MRKLRVRGPLGSNVYLLFFASIVLAISSLYCDDSSSTATPTSADAQQPTQTPTSVSRTPTIDIPTATAEPGPSVSPTTSSPSIATLEPSVTATRLPTPFPSATVSLGETPQPTAIPTPQVPTPETTATPTLTPTPPPTTTPVPDKVVIARFDAIPNATPTPTAIPTPTRPVPTPTPTPTPTLTPTPPPTTTPVPDKVVILMAPSSTLEVPIPMIKGETVELTVRVLPNGVNIQAVSISLSFDPEFLEVVDALSRSGVQILSHPDNPLDQFIPENKADNTNGTIRFTGGATNTVSNEFNLSVITFKAIETVTPTSSPTEVVFLVKNGDETQASTSGAALLATTENYTAAFISIGES